METRERARLIAQELLLEAEYEDEDECELCADNGFSECQGHLYDEEAGSYVPVLRANDLVE